MSRQVSRGSADEYQADEQAGLRGSAGENQADEQAGLRGSAAEYQAVEQEGAARLIWRVLGR